MANEKRLIDANTLMAYFEEQYNLAMDDPDLVSGYVMAALRCCIDYFKTIPAVDAVEVVHGRWEWLGPYRYNDDGVIGTCSVCKERLRLFARNYCPNCGAKMDDDGNGNL